LKENLASVGAPGAGLLGGGEKLPDVIRRPVYVAGTAAQPILQSFERSGREDHSDIIIIVTEWDGSRSMMKISQDGYANC
jgi:hypothetical protein